MFSPEQINVMKPVLGTSYTEDVLKILQEKKIKSRKGDLYSAAYVRDIFTGRHSNTQIEAAILEVYQQRKTENDRIKWEKERLTSETN